MWLCDASCSTYTESHIAPSPRYSFKGTPITDYKCPAWLYFVNSIAYCYTIVAYKNGTHITDDPFFWTDFSVPYYNVSTTTQETSKLEEYVTGFWKTYHLYTNEIIRI